MFLIKNLVKHLGGRFFQNYLSLYPGLKNIHLILMYHKVLEEVPEGLYDPAMIVTKTTFEMHIREIARFFDIVPLDQVLELKEEGKRRCTITFDDSWIDNYEVAFPILKKYRVPATVFVPVALIGSEHWFWWESLYYLANQTKAKGNDHIFVEYFSELVTSWNTPSLESWSLSRLMTALKESPADRLDGFLSEAYVDMGITPPTQRTMMSWREMEEMGRHGISFGSHSLHHFILNDLSCELKRHEVVESLRLLENKDVCTVPFFSFPNGSWDRKAVDFVASAGYRGSVTTKNGYNSRQTDPFLLNRVGLHEYMSHTVELFWFRILQSILAGSKSGEEIKKLEFDFSGSNTKDELTVRP
jgi:peptidoglycan/xylan/chitin deacetylase (PgdA/CDA1 family)